MNADDRENMRRGAVVAFIMTMPLAAFAVLDLEYLVVGLATTFAGWFARGWLAVQEDS